MKLKRHHNFLNENMLDTTFRGMTKYLDQISKHFNVSVGKQLGKGAHAISYEADGDKAIRLTPEGRAANNYNKLIGTKYNHFNDYYNVVRLIYPNEKLLNEEEFEKSDLKGWFHDDYEMYMSDHFPFAILSKKLSILSKDNKYWDGDSGRSFFRKELSDDNFMEDLPENHKLYFEQYIEQRQDMLKEGEELGIIFDDHGGDNIGLDDGKLVFFDLGGFEDIKGELKTINNLYLK